MSDNIPNDSETVSRMLAALPDLKNYPPARGVPMTFTADQWRALLAQRRALLSDLRGLRVYAGTSMEDGCMPKKERLQLCQRITAMILDMGDL